MASALFPSPYFSQPGSPCFCGKGKPFSKCCGSNKQHRKPPHGVIIKKGALNVKQCQQLVSYAAKQDSKRLAVSHKENTEPTSLERQSSAIDMGNKHSTLVSLVEKLLNIAAAEMNLQIKHFTPPTLMHYGSGDYYHQHSDSEVFNPNLKKWEKKVDRDISLLLYLNDDFDGGDLLFNYFNYTYSPRQGDLVIFPSDHRYLHEAKAVTKGSRYVIVSWAATLPC